MPSNNNRIQTFQSSCFYQIIKAPFYPDPCFRVFAYTLNKKIENIVGIHDYTLINLLSSQNDLKLLNCGFSIII